MAVCSSFSILERLFTFRWRKWNPLFLKPDQVSKIWVEPEFNLTFPDNSRINLKNFVWYLLLISFRVSRLELTYFLIVETFSLIFKDPIVKKSPLENVFKLLWSSFWLSVLKIKQEIENCPSKNNMSNCVLVLVNCFSPNTSDKATF